MRRQSTSKRGGRLVLNTPSSEEGIQMIVPRAKRQDRDSQDPNREKAPVILTRSILQSLFHLPLSVAAAQLTTSTDSNSKPLPQGLSPTTVKKACRRIGIVKWPYTSSRNNPGVKKVAASPGSSSSQPAAFSSTKSASSQVATVTTPEEINSGLYFEEGARSHGSSFAVDLSTKSRPVELQTEVRPGENVENDGEDVMENDGEDAMEQEEDSYEEEEEEEEEEQDQGTPFSSERFDVTYHTTNHQPTQPGSLYHANYESNIYREHRQQPFTHLSVPPHSAFNDQRYGVPDRHPAPHSSFFPSTLPGDRSVLSERLATPQHYTESHTMMGGMGSDLGWLDYGVEHL